MTVVENRYLVGNYAPVADEVTCVDLPVTGSLPEALRGRYLRNGPNPLVAPEPSTYHWFAGDGMVHGIRIRDGRAEWYRNRYVRSAAVATALGEPVRPGPVHADMDFASNTNVIGHAGRTFAIVEAGARPYELTYELDTVGPSDFGGTLPGGYTAHPKRDPATGELHAMSYFWGWGNVVQYTVIDASWSGPKGRRHRGRRFREHPRHVAHRTIRGRSTTSPSCSTSKRPCRGPASRTAGIPITGPASGLVEREGTAEDVSWFDVEPCYVFHPMNAYDDGDHVVLDVVRHPRMFDTHRLGPDEGTPTLDRWTLDLATGKVVEERLDDRGQEFPRVDERLVGRRHRYGYAGAFLENDSALIKHDVDRRTSEVRHLHSDGGAVRGGLRSGRARRGRG